LTVGVKREQIKCGYCCG